MHIHDMKIRDILHISRIFTNGEIADFHITYMHYKFFYQICIRGFVIADLRENCYSYPRAYLVSQRLWHDTNKKEQKCCGADANVT